MILANGLIQRTISPASSHWSFSRALRCQDSCVHHPTVLRPCVTNCQVSAMSYLPLYISHLKSCPQPSPCFTFDTCLPPWFTFLLTFDSSPALLLTYLVTCIMVLARSLWKESFLAHNISPVFQESQASNQKVSLLLELGDYGCWNAHEPI